MRRLWLIIPLLLLCAAAPGPGTTSDNDPGTGPGPGIGAVTKLPVPRFVSLRSDQVNFRAGPGFQYPVTWVYQRTGLPVEVIGEFDVWRQVRAPDGGTGWVHEATLRPRRGFYITAPQVVLHTGPNAGAGVAAYLDQGVSGDLLRCDPHAAFCKVGIDHRTGYLARGDFWGAFPDETVLP
ncbi:SH3 domain-containing protein [Acidocella sp.]|uniref:SH3 domain-containing protein n=1 Tax=Acidocella sp. TaxID=50710 RepID=UPI0026347313|nr:SH3 domain-containing protein [Acidocella sp.]